MLRRSLSRLWYAALVVMALAGPVLAHTSDGCSSNCDCNFTLEHCTARPDHPRGDCRTGHRTTGGTSCCLDSDVNCFFACFPGGVNCSFTSKCVPDLSDAQCQCGNGQVDPGEECDWADPNTRDCCDGFCRWLDSSYECASDGNPCTSDRCDPDRGCTHTNLPYLPVPTFCDTGNPCFYGFCQNGRCDQYPVFGTDDHNPCTTDSCEPGRGFFHTPLTGTPCTDNNACTTSDTCGNGTCAPGPLEDCLDGNSCTRDSCDPVSDCQHSAPIAGCDSTRSKEGFVGGPNNTACTNGTYDADLHTCTLSSPNLDLIIPAGALTTPTNITIVTTPANRATGACDFALNNYLSEVATCIQLEPSGLEFATPIIASFKWTNVLPCSRLNCCVSAVDSSGFTAVLAEGTLQVFTQGKCLPTSPVPKCEVTNTVCTTDADCVIALTPDCGNKQSSSRCPACPGTGCSSGVFPTLDYATCTPPCVPPASCSPESNRWIVQLSHFSQYAVGAVPLPPDHAQCYRARLLSTTPVTAPVKLVDAFGTVSAAVIKPLKLCSPTNTNDEAPEALSHTDYLQSYAIRALNRRELDARLPLRGQKIIDQFGTLTLDLRLPDRFLVATAISFDGQPAAPSASSLDRFTCYKVRQSKGAPRFQPTDVTVTDPFNQSQATVRLKRPVRVCVPTNKDDQQPGAETNPWQLMCYRASPPFTQVRRLQTNNELGPSLVYPLLRDELCVPALKGS